MIGAKDTISTDTSQPSAVELFQHEKNFAICNVPRRTKAGQKCHSQTVSFILGHADPDCAACMSCCSPFNFARRRHLCRSCLKTICMGCVGTTISFFGNSKPPLRCRDCLLVAVPLMDLGGGLDLRCKTPGRQVDAKAPDPAAGCQSSLAVKPFAKGVHSAISSSSHWGLLVATHALWKGSVPPETHRCFLREMGDHQLGNLWTPLSEYLLGMSRAPGNPLFATMQAFAWELQESNRHWRDQGPRRTLLGAKADMAAFKRCAFPALHSSLFDGVGEPVVAEVLRWVLDKEAQSRAHPVLRDVLRALHAPKDHLLNALMECTAAAEAYEAIPGEQRGDFSPVARVLRQMSLCTDAESKLQKVLEAVRLVHTILDGRGSTIHHAIPGESPPKTSSHAEASKLQNPCQRAASTGGPCSVVLLPPPPSGADSLMPVFIHCILASGVPCIWAELEFIREFLGEQQHTGPLGYTLCTLEAALCWILDRFAGYEHEPGAAGEGRHPAL
eukprot:GGOE01053527.1.p1 GENE.GGOE01053527.1~~GGOE01053527.1.p1  ORF type:complete len:501 (+),score=58.63 GGOE01053527.1:237-1739(+)